MSLRPGPVAAPPAAQAPAQARVATGGRLGLVLAAGERAVATGATDAQNRANEHRENKLNKTLKALKAKNEAIAANKAATKKLETEHAATLKAIAARRAAAEKTELVACKTQSASATKAEKDAEIAAMEKKKAELKAALKELEDKKSEINAQKIMRETEQKRLDAEARKDNAKDALKGAAAGAKKGVLKAAGDASKAMQRMSSKSAFAFDDLGLDEAPVGGPARILFEKVRNYELGQGLADGSDISRTTWDLPNKLMGVPEAYAYMIDRMIRDEDERKLAFLKITPDYKFGDLARELFELYMPFVEGRQLDSKDRPVMPIINQDRWAERFANEIGQVRVFNPNDYEGVQPYYYLTMDRPIRTPSSDYSTQALARAFAGLYSLCGWEVAAAVELYAEWRLAALGTQIALNPGLQTYLLPRDWHTVTSTGLLETYLPPNALLPAGADVDNQQKISVLMCYLWSLQQVRDPDPSRHTRRFDELARDPTFAPLLAAKNKNFGKLLQLGLLKVRHRRVHQTADGRSRTVPAPF